MPADRPDRPNRRNDRPAGRPGDRDSRPNRPEQSGRPDRPDRQEFRAGQGGGGFRPGGDRPGFQGGPRPGGWDRPNRTDRPDRPDRPNFQGGARPGGWDRPNRDDRQGGNDRPARPNYQGGQRPGGWDRPNRDDRPARPGGSDRPNYQGGARPGGWDRPNRDDRQDRPERPSAPRFDDRRPGPPRGRADGFERRSYGDPQQRSSERPDSDRPRFDREDRPAFQPRNGGARPGARVGGPGRPVSGRPTPRVNEGFRPPFRPAAVSAVAAEADETTQEFEAPEKAQTKTVKAAGHLLELPILAGTEEVPEPDIDGMTYIAYGEQGDDVAFELTDDLEEALGIMEQMQDDGFKVKLFQAQEIDVVKEDDDSDAS